MVMVVMNDWFIPMVNETPQVLLVGAKQDRRHPIIHEHIRLILRFVENLSIPNEHLHDIY